MSDSIISSGVMSTSRRDMMRSSTSPPGSTSMSSSRPFLHLLNPLGRNYRGYEQAHADLVEEEDEEEDTEGDDDDRGEGPSRGRASWLHSHPGPGGVNPIPMHSVHTETPENQQHHGQYEDEEDDGEVPQSFMIEARRGTKPPQSRNAGSDTKLKTAGMPPQSRSRIYRKSSRVGFGDAKPPVSMPPRPSDLQSTADFTLPAPNTASPASQAPSKRGLDEYERALWNWVNVYNLDAFLQEVYAYYTGKGIYCIALSRGLNLLTVGFVIGFSTFLLGCIDYSAIPGTTKLSNVLVSHCVSRFSGFTLLFFISFGAFWTWNFFTFVVGILRLLDMYRFYTYLLDIPDADIQTISWPEIVRRIGKIRESNPVTALSSANALTTDSVTAPLDAHDIANRIMRQENYLIALFNKELLNLRFPLPPVIERLLGTGIGEQGQGRTLTKALEWNLRFCLLGFLFDHDGRVRKPFVTQKNRKALVEALRRRFIFMGCLNAIFAPFIVLYLIMYSFFRYFEEYHKNPSSIGGRQYTPFAQWKFREFNELPHLFTRRLHESYPAASEYIDQFPNEKMALVMKFVSFIAGSFAAVLVVASIIDPDHFLHFEITPHRTVLFYVGVFGSVLAVARGMIPEDHQVFDTEDLIREVIRYTHYMPQEWKGQLHSQKVHKEFGHLFEMKIAVYFQELLSVLLTPFILWFSLPPSSPAIIDFFREFSVHVDGLGYVCSFAVFDFKRHGNINFGAPTETNDERYLSKEGKMEKSFLNFKAANPDWNPSDPAGSIYLSRIADLTPVHGPPVHRRHPRFGNRLGTDLRHNAAYGGTRAFTHAPIPQIHSPGSGATPPMSQEQRNAERAKMYETAFQKSHATKSPAGDVGGPGASRAAKLTAAVKEPSTLTDEDIRSDLGDSYVDGVGPRGPKGLDDDGVADQVEVEELANGGVMGLLTQIYDQRRPVL